MRANSRNSGGIRRRPAESISTSCAKPTRRRFHTLNWRSRLGNAMTWERMGSQAGAGYSRRQLSGCAVSTSFTVPPWVNGSRVRVGTAIRPFASRLTCAAPWNTSLPHVFPLPHTVVKRLERVKGNKRHFFLVRQGVSAGFSRQIFSAELHINQIVMKQTESNLARALAQENPRQRSCEITFSLFHNYLI